MNVHSDKRSLILDSAVVTFGELGFSNATMKDIAQAAKIAPGSIYNYFQDKNELFRSAVEGCWETFFAEMDQVIQQKSQFVLQLEAVIDIGFDRLQILHPLFRGMFSEANRLDLFAKPIEALCSRLDQLLVAGAAEGVVTIDQDPGQRTFFLRLMVSGVLFTASITPPDELPDEIERMRRRAKQGLFTGADRGNFR